MDTFRIRHGKLLTNDHNILILNSVITASQRTRAYSTTVVLDTVTHQICGPRVSCCECVVSCGPGCSHQLALILTAVCVTMMTNQDELEKLPSHVQAAQRTAMTIEYAYGYNSRNTLLKLVRLPHAVHSDTDSTSRTRRRGRDTPEPLVSFVQEVFDVWRLQATNIPTQNQLRVTDILKNTADTIKEYPRNEHEQHKADLARERVYLAYKEGRIKGWDDEIPPLDLHLGGVLRVAPIKKQIQR